MVYPASISQMFTPSLKRSICVNVQFRTLRFGAKARESIAIADRDRNVLEKNDQLPMPSNDFALQDHDVSGGILSKIDVDPASQGNKLQLPPETFDKSKLLRIAMLGKPNVGKSHLTNALTGFSVQAVSSKINTTRHNAKAVCTLSDENTQLIFVDTPGLVSLRQAKKSKINKEIVYDPEMSLKHVDLILVLHDLTNEYSYKILDSKILHLLYRYRHLPSILVLNKIDALKGRLRILEIIHSLTNSRVDNKMLARQTSKIYEMLSKDKRITDILASYKSKRLEEETRLQKRKEDALKKHDNSNAIADVASCQSKTAISSVSPKTGETSSGSVEFDKTLWNVDWATMAKIEDKQMHEVPLNQLRKCFLHERGWPYFKAVFTISALHGTGVDKLRKFLVDMAKPGSWKYHSSVVTPMNSIALAKETVRSKTMDVVEGYVAYNLKYNVVVWEVNEHDTLCIYMNIVCERDAHIPVILGTNGKNILAISQAARQELSNLFGRDVYVKLEVVSLQAPNKRLKR